MNVTLEILERMKNEDLLELGLEMIKRRKLVEVNKVDVSDQIEEMSYADFGKVRNKIEQKENGSFVITIPKCDERKDGFYQVPVFNKNESDIFPLRGYFICIEGEVSERVFGLLDISYIGKHISRNDNDWRFSKENIKFIENDHFYFDFNDEKYIQVSPQELNKVKFKRSKGEESKKVSNEVNEYLRREQLYEYFMTRVNVIGKEYLKHFSGYTKFKRSPVSISETDIFFSEYGRFLNGIENGLKSKLLLSRMSSIEFEKIMEERDRQLSLIEKGRQHLNDIEDILNSTQSLDDVRSLSLKDNLSGTGEKYFIDLTMVIKGIQDFLTSRPSPPVGLSGYTGFDLERNELYPNVVELERRGSRTQKAWNHTLENEVQNQILDRIRKKSR